MIETILYVAIFLGAALLCALEPGPNFVQLSLQAMRNGRRHAIWTALGMHMGAYPYVIAAAIGLASLLAVMPTLLTALKWLAGGYLIWLGVQALFGGRKSRDAAGTARDAGEVQFASAFTKGMLLVLGNPRTPLFYATFPLLFVSTASSVSPGLQILAIALATNAVFLWVDVMFVYTLEKTRLRDRLPNFSSLFRWIGGGLLVGFGVKQLLARN